jgi:hypothetical protein
MNRIEHAAIDRRPDSLFALMLGPAHAQSVQRIDVTEFGIYTAGTKQIYHAPQSTTGIAQRVSASSIDRGP